MSTTFSKNLDGAISAIGPNFSVPIKFKRTFKKGIVGQFVNSWPETERIKFNNLVKKEYLCPKLRRLKEPEVLKRISRLQSLQQDALFDYLRDSIREPAVITALLSDRVTTTFKLLAKTDETTFRKFVHLFATTQALDVVTGAGFVKAVCGEIYPVRICQLVAAIDMDRSGCVAISSPEVLNLLSGGAVDNWTHEPLYELLRAIGQTGETRRMTRPEFIEAMGKQSDNAKEAVCKAACAAADIGRVTDPRMISVLGKQTALLNQEAAVKFMVMFTTVKPRTGLQNSTGVGEQAKPL